MHWPQGRVFMACADRVPGRRCAQDGRLARVGLRTVQAVQVLQQCRGRHNLFPPAKMQAQAPGMRQSRSFRASRTPAGAPLQRWPTRCRALGRCASVADPEAVDALAGRKAKICLPACLPACLSACLSASLRVSIHCPSSVVQQAPGLQTRVKPA